MTSSSLSLGSFLNLSERPPAIQEACDQAFETVKGRTGWGLYNGSDRYDLLGPIKDHELIGALIRQITTECPTQKEYTIIDIGAGGFQWGKAVAEYINREIRPNLTVNIYSVRGESLKPLSWTPEEFFKRFNEGVEKLHEYKLAHDEDHDVFTQKVEKLRDAIICPQMHTFEEGVCRIHNLGEFKVENIGTEFLKRGIDLHEKVHFAISHMCFTHLVDPLGTFLEVINLLAPSYGHAWIDGFPFSIGSPEGTRVHNTASSDDLLNLMTETHTAFLRMGSISLPADSFLIRRTGDTPPQIKMSYHDLVRDYENENPSRRITLFSRKDPLPNVLFSYPPEVKKAGRYFRMKLHLFYGDRPLFEWLKEQDVFVKYLEHDPVLIEVTPS
jgi:hypothetical protein